MKASRWVPWAVFGFGVLVAAWLSLVGARPRSMPGEPVETRLVSLSPAITETIGALGATDQLVGRSSWCTLPESVQALPALGSALAPDLERLAGVRPTRILVDGSAGVRTRELEALAPVEALPWLTLDEVLHSITRLGLLTGTAPAAARLSEKLAVLGDPPPDDAPRVLLALLGDGLERGEVWFIKRNSLHGAALHAAGARNAVDRDVEGSPVLSLEGLVELDPEVVIVLGPEPVTDEGRAAVLEDWATLSTVRAVKEGRVGVIGGPALLSTGPSILDAVDMIEAELARLRGD